MLQQLPIRGNFLTLSETFVSKIKYSLAQILFFFRNAEQFKGYLTKLKTEELE